MPKELNFHEDVKIDPLNLIEEWNNQSVLYYDYEVEHSKREKDKELLIAQASKLDRKIKIERCEIELKIRKDPEAYGISKPTDSAVRAIVLTQDSIKKLYDEYFDIQERLADASYEARALNAASWSFVHRKDSLLNITNLYLKEYYATTVGTKNSGLDDQVTGLKTTLKKRT